MSLINELFTASANKDLEKVKLLLEKNPNLINAGNASGQTILHVCIKDENKELFDYLLTLDSIDIEIRSQDRIPRSKALGDKPLNYSVRCSDLYFLKKLLEKGAKVDGDDYDAVFGIRRHETALQDAAESGKAEACEILIEHGADVNAVAYYLENLHRTPLRGAISLGNSQIVEMLLFYGVDVLGDADIDYFELALELSEFEIQNMLIKYRFDNLEPLRVEVLAKTYNYSYSTDLVRNILELVDSVVYDKQLDRNELELFSYCVMSMDDETLSLFLDKFHYINRCDMLHNILFKLVEYNYSREFYEKALTIFDRFAQCFAETYDGEESIFPPAISTFSEEILEVYGTVLLSHGVKISTEDLFKVYRYERSASNGLFKFMLNLKIEDLADTYTCHPPYPLRSIVPALIFDPTLTLEKFASMPEVDPNDPFVRYLLNFSALPRVKRRILEGGINVNLVRLGESPDVPSLVELARNAARSYLIKTFEVRRSHEYLDVVRKLDVPMILKNVLCFFTSLYNVTR